MKYLAWLTMFLATGLSFSAIAPVAAQEGTSPTTETTTPATTSPTTESTTTNNAQTIKGTIKSIIGQVVIVELANGGTATLSVSKDQIGTYNLQQGMYIVATQRNGLTIVESASYAAGSRSESSTADRILNLKVPVVSRETSETTGSSSTTYTESSTPTNNNVTTTTTVETAEPLPATPRALW